MNRLHLVHSFLRLLLRCIRLQSQIPDLLIKAGIVKAALAGPNEDGPNDRRLPPGPRSARVKPAGGDRSNHDHARPGASKFGLRDYAKIKRGTPASSSGTPYSDTGGGWPPRIHGALSGLSRAVHTVLFGSKSTEHLRRMEQDTAPHTRLRTFGRELGVCRWESKKLRKLVTVGSLVDCTNRDPSDAKLERLKAFQGSK